MRRLRLYVAEQAAREIRDARAWWIENRTDAPAAFVGDLRRAIDLIRSQPHAGARARNLRGAEIRRVHLSRLKYDLYYRVTGDGRGLVLLAFWHSSRGSGPDL